MDNALSTRTITDRETGEEYVITPQLTGKAENTILRIQHNLMDICLNLKMIKEDKLYLYAMGEDGEVGYETFADFAVERLPWSFRQVQKYISIADSFLGSQTGENNEKFFQLPFTSLYELSQLPQETKDEMLETGTLVLATGEELSIEALTKIATADLEKKLRVHKKKYSDLNVTHEELKEEYDSEVKELKDEIKHLDGMINIPPEERKFHKRITKSREARTKIYESQSLMDAAFMGIYQIDIGDENREVIADIEGFMVSIARRLLDLESQFGVSLGYYKESMKTAAGE